MTSLVERLRKYASPQWSVGAPAYVCTEAADTIEALCEALRVVAVGEGCMNGIREELSADALRKIARAALERVS
jgi:hypothetical protein